MIGQLAILGKFDPCVARPVAVPAEFEVYHIGAFWHPDAVRRWRFAPPWSVLTFHPPSIQMHQQSLRNRGFAEPDGAPVIFDVHIGIDYSGAATPTSRLAGLQVYAATTGPAERIATPDARASKRRNWTRQAIAEWLIAQARSGPRFAAGIDHGFSFPLSYFQRYGIPSWPEFLDDFVAHWPTHEPHTRVDSIRDRGDRPPARAGSRTDLRLTERWTSSAKSVFQFDVQGSVAKSTHAGLPWLLHIRREVGDLVHFWPFDGWQVPSRKHVLAEVYPSIFRNRYPREERTVDQQDACAIARWLTDMDARGFLQRYFDPPLTDEERKAADLEGWILGIM